SCSCLSPSSCLVLVAPAVTRRVVSAVNAVVGRGPVLVVVEDVDLPRLAARPPYVQVTERCGLLERDGGLPEELEQREEPRDDDGGRVRVLCQGTERRA